MCIPSWQQEWAFGSAAGLCGELLGQVVSTPHGEANFKGISGKMDKEVSQCMIHIT